MWRVALILALVAVTVLALSGSAGWLPNGVLMMFPALALAIVMLTRPYLGERTIARLRARLAPRRPPAAPSRAVALRRHTTVARGGRLIAVALAGRAPPVALADRR